MNLVGLGGWALDRSFAWATRFRRLARAYERLPQTVAAPQFVAFACLMLQRLINVVAQSPQQTLAAAGQRPL